MQLNFLTTDKHGWTRIRTGVLRHPVSTTESLEVGRAKKRFHRLGKIRVHPCPSMVELSFPGSGQRHLV